MLSFASHMLLHHSTLTFSLSTHCLEDPSNIFPFWNISKARRPAAVFNSFHWLILHKYMYVQLNCFFNGGWWVKSSTQSTWLSQLLGHSSLYRISILSYVYILNHIVCSYVISIPIKLKIYTCLSELPKIIITFQ